MDIYRLLGRQAALEKLGAMFGGKLVRAVKAAPRAPSHAIISPTARPAVSTTCSRVGQKVDAASDWMRSNVTP